MFEVIADSQGSILEQRYLGELPLGWSSKRLRDIAAKITDGTHVTPSYIAEGIPFLRVTDIQDREINLERVKRISLEEHRQLTQRCKPEQGDILLSKNGSIGFVKVVTWNWEFSIFVSLALIKLKKESGVYPFFLKAVLESPVIQKQIYAQSKQGTVTNLHLEEIEKFFIPIPPLSEQKGIIEILATWDEAIALTERAIEARRKRKNFLIQKFFNPSFFDEEYETLPLEEIAIVERGKFTARPRNDPRYFGGSIPFVQTGDVVASNGFITTYSQTLNEAGLEVSRLFPKGSILVTIAANIGDVAITEIDVACPDSIVVVQAKTGVCREWLKYALSSKKDDLDALATQNAQKNINLQVLRPLLIHVPSKDKQEKIAKVLLDCDKEIAQTIRLLELYRKQKQGLMQKLLIGECRVAVQEAA